MRFAGDKSNASLLLAVPVIPVFLGDADRGILGPLMLLRVECTVVGSCPVPIDKPLETFLQNEPHGIQEIVHHIRIGATWAVRM